MVDGKIFWPWIAENGVPMNKQSNGLIAVVKRDCPTCVLVVPLFGGIARSAGPMTVYC